MPSYKKPNGDEHFYTAGIEYAHSHTNFYGETTYYDNNENVIMRSQKGPYGKIQYRDKNGLLIYEEPLPVKSAPQTKVRVKIPEWDELDVKQREKILNSHRENLKQHKDTEAGLRMQMLVFAVLGIIVPYFGILNTAVSRIFSRNLYHKTFHLASLSIPAYSAFIDVVSIVSVVLFLLFYNKYLKYTRNLKMQNCLSNGIKHYENYQGRQSDSEFRKQIYANSWSEKALIPAYALNIGMMIFVLYLWQFFLNQWVANRYWFFSVPFLIIWAGLIIPVFIVDNSLHEYKRPLYVDFPVFYDSGCNRTIELRRQNTAIFANCLLTVFIPDFIEKILIGQTSQNILITIITISCLLAVVYCVFISKQFIGTFNMVMISLLFLLTAIVIFRHWSGTAFETIGYFSSAYWLIAFVASFMIFRDA